MAITGERLRRAWFRHPLVAFVRHRRLITFYAQLHSLIKAGIPLPTAFNQLESFAPDAVMAKGLGSVARDVRNGTTLGDAMRRHAALFDDANVELIAFAEEAGRLEPIAAAIVQHLERVQQQRWKALMGALWPMYLAAAFVFVGPLLGVAQSGSANVGGTYLVGLINSVFTVALVVGGVLSVPFVIAALDVEVKWDRFKRGLPFVAAPMRTLAASRFVLGLGLASASGMEMVRALRLAAKATVSPSIIEDVTLAEKALQGGSSLTEAVRTLAVLEQPSLGILAIAETTGTLDEALQKVSKDLEDSSLRALRFLTIAVTVLVAGVILVKLVASMLGVLLGPVKAFYDAAGSGKVDGVDLER